MKYNFVFNGNKTNEVTAHGKQFYLNKIDFGNGCRVDIITDNDIVQMDNTNNDSFRKVVDRTKPLNEQISQWANYILDQYSICDICGKFELVLPLASYDYETFPQLREKNVCQKCRANFYTEHIKGIEEAMKKEEQNIKQ